MDLKISRLDIALVYRNRFGNTKHIARSLFNSLRTEFEMSSTKRVVLCDSLPLLRHPNPSISMNNWQENGRSFYNIRWLLKRLLSLPLEPNLLPSHKKSRYCSLYCTWVDTLESSTKRLLNSVFGTSKARIDYVRVQKICFFILTAWFWFSFLMML